MTIHLAPDRLSSRFLPSFHCPVHLRINPSQFADAINRLNDLFDEAESITPGVFMENVLGCLTAYLAFLCIQTHYEKVLQQVTLAVKDLNETVFIPCGLLMIDPAERGLRVVSF
ncbi:Golgin subfamily A member 7 [Fasciolopsis buskii]|uniref:Ras modification protein ERF4 n=1 Tax=Fasciolopsis buskii TaxID=27845 RepID=A0A8E0RN23_9TREM|nr:Golgin subfamily A member 7 [Fasciolopsis buski]